MRYVERARPATAVLTEALPGIYLPLQFYATHGPVPKPVFAVFGDPRSRLAGERRPMWIVLDLSAAPVSTEALLSYDRPLAAAAGYRPTVARIFGGSGSA